MPFPSPLRSTLRRRPSPAALAGAVTSLLSLGVALLPVAAARAQWTVACSCDTSPSIIVTYKSPPSGWSADYSGAGPYGGKGDSSDQQGGLLGPGTAQCKGEITATVTWGGGGTPPPLTVVEVEEEQWAGEGQINQNPAPMHQCPNAPMHQCPNAPMHQRHLP